MVNLKTGKHFTDPSARSQMTRGGFLKGILASGIAPSLTLGAVSLAGSANANVRGMMRGVGGRSAAMVGWTNPYITDGLIAMWDGEWNAGAGTHSDSTKLVWKDLSGKGRDLPSTHWSGVGVSSWGRNFASFDGIVRGFTLSGFSEINSIKTMEVVFMSFMQNVYGAIYTLRTSADVGKTILMLSEDNDLTFSGRYALDIPITTGTVQLFSFSGKNVYLNGDIKSQTKGGISTIEQTRITVGSSGSVNLFNGNIYCLRLYNRELADTELSRNYSVDRHRFGVP